MNDFIIIQHVDFVKWLCHAIFVYLCQLFVLVVMLIICICTLSDMCLIVDFSVVFVVV